MLARRDSPTAEMIGVHSAKGKETTEQIEKARTSEQHPVVFVKCIWLTSAQQIRIDHVASCW